MAKTDDPTFNQITALNLEIKRLQENMEHVFQFIRATNEFLNVKYPHDIHDWCGVVSWYNQKIHQEQEARDLQEQITSLQTKGYVVTMMGSN